MPKRERVLGTIQIVLLHLVSEKQCADTSGDSLQKEIEKIVDHPVSKPQVSTALRRLKVRGLLTVMKAPPTGRRGNPKQLYSLTKEGLSALSQYRRIARFVAGKSSGLS